MTLGPGHPPADQSAGALPGADRPGDHDSLGRKDFYHSERVVVTSRVAADTAWAIASPETHHQLVREAGYTYDQLEAWVRTTLSAALFPDQ